MSSSFKEKIDCSVCGSVLEGKFYHSINVTLDPSLKASFFNRRINWIKCTSCGTDIFVPIEFTYHDMEKEFLVIFKHPNSSETNTENSFAEFNDRLKLAKYFSFPIIVNDPYELILAAEYCDKKRGPKSKEEARDLVMMIKKSIKSMNIPEMKNAPVSDSVSSRHPESTPDVPVQNMLSSALSTLKIILVLGGIILFIYWIFWGRTLVIDTHGEPLNNVVNLSYFELLRPDMSRTQISESMGQPTRIDVPYTEDDGIGEIDYAEIRWIYERQNARLNYYVAEKDIPGGSVEYLPENMEVNNFLYKMPDSLFGKRFIEIRNGEEKLMFVRLRSDDTIKEINWYRNN